MVASLCSLPLDVLAQMPKYIAACGGAYRSHGGNPTDYSGRSALPRLLLKKACRKHQPCHALSGAVLAAAQKFLNGVLQLRKPKLEPALRPLRQPTGALDTQKGNDQSFLMSVFLSISTISIQMPWRNNLPNVNLAETK